jgi:hypothetical protein
MPRCQPFSNAPALVDLLVSRRDPLLLIFLEPR